MKRQSTLGRGPSVLFGLVLSSALGLLGCAQADRSSQSVYASSESTGIIGGTEATGDEDFLKSIAIVYNVGMGSLCTASIYSDTILITAAHCVDGPASSMRVVFGTDLSNAETRIVRAVNSYLVSPLWPFRQNEILNAGDIAIVKFEGGLPAGFVPAEILSDTSDLVDGETVLLAGYGMDNGVAKTGGGKLRYVETTIENAAFSETEVLIDQKLGKGACHGDSGGPAYVKVAGQWKLFGVTNRGINDAEDHCNVSAAYANIPAYMSWIEESVPELRVASGFSGN